MKSSRSPKFRRITAFVIIGVLFALIVVSAVLVPCSALVSVTDVNASSLPACFMSFNFRVYSSKDIVAGMRYSYRSFNIPITAQYGYEYVDNGIVIDYDMVSNVQVPFAESYDVGVFVQNSQFDYYGEIAEYGFDYEASYELFVNTLYGVRQPLSHRTDLYAVTFTAGDYYVWGTEFLNYDEAYGNTSPLEMRINIPEYCYDDLSFSVSYSLLGDTEVHTYSLQGDDVPHDQNYVYFDVQLDDLGVSEDTAVYVHGAQLEIIDYDTIEAFDNEYKLENGLEGNYFYIDIQGSSLNADLRRLDVQSHTVEYEFQNYTAWLASAVGGFLGTEIFGGITFGGLLAMVVGFFGVLWFLKVFAGG